MKANRHEELRIALQGLAEFKKVRNKDNEYIACCPAHDDHNPSLAITVAPDEKILLNCRSGGCTPETIVKKMGFEVKDLFPPRGGEGASHTRKASATLQPHRAKAENTRAEGLHEGVQPDCNLQPQEGERDAPNAGCALAAYAEAKRLPIGFLKMQGLSEFTYQGAPAVRIPYREASGVERSVQFRIALDKTAAGDDRFRWKSGSKAINYGLWRLPAERERGDVITIVEGASDCHTLWFHGFAAIGIPGADTWRDERDAPALDGFNTIYLVIEPDRGGEAVRKWLATSRIRDRVRLVDLGEHKDPSGLYLADPERFAERWHQALEVATPWTEQEASERKQTADTAWAACADLAQRNDILATFTKAIAADGVVGEERTVKLIYLAVTSRVLDAVVSLILKGPSSAGKSYTTERVLRYFPEAAFYALSAMSERSLAYSDEPVSHRMMVFYEAAGIRGDFATYLLRTLLSEGCIRYDTVEKTPEGMRPRQIVRPGPAGALITTTEVQLHAENETRMLSVSVMDTKEQTARILEAQAHENHVAPDRAAWLALQTWIASAEHRVTIPFAAVLAKAIPPVAVRLRRDFPQVLNLIRAHAVLHQATREKDANGRIVATLDDYAAVRELVYDLISDGVEATVPATVRATVAAVEQITKDSGNSASVTVAQVAAKLNLDKSAAMRRVQTTIKRGYLKNLEERKGHAAQLVIGDKMPDDVVVLPTRETLEDGCGLHQGCKAHCNPSEQETTASEGNGCRVAADTEGIETPPPPNRDCLRCKSRCWQWDGARWAPGCQPSQEAPV